jgi:hypothetical protein
MRMYLCKRCFKSLRFVIFNPAVSVTALVEQRRGFPVSNNLVHVKYLCISRGVVAVHTQYWHSPEAPPRYLEQCHLLTKERCNVRRMCDTDCSTAWRRNGRCLSGSFSAETPTRECENGQSAATEIKRFRTLFRMSGAAPSAVLSSKLLKMIEQNVLKTTPHAGFKSTNVGSDRILEHCIVLLK